jgi:adenylate kinase
MQCDAIFIVGPQGSGKGTQAKLLAERLGFFWWDMGRVLREERTWKFADGRTVGEIIDAGILLTDEQLIEVAKEKLSKLPAEQGVVFDGIPRRIGQAEFLFEMLKAQGRKFFFTLHVSLPREESMKRLLKRAEIEKRSDDTPEKIEMRLQAYEEATVPMLEYLKEHTVFAQVDGMPSISEVTQEIEKAISSVRYL